MNDKAQTIPQVSAVSLVESALPVETIIRQVELVKQVVTSVMREGEHFGKIPGTKRPTLLQPGADVLLLTFRLDPQFEIDSVTDSRDLVSVVVRCTLYHQTSGTRIASGLGAANSRETKYRFRNDIEPTGAEVPGEYWEARKRGDNRDAERNLGGKDFRAEKIDGKWQICRAVKVEDDNPQNHQNTLVKMAAKRAKVAAVLNALGISDLFTQDLEDLLANGIKPEDGDSGQDPNPGQGGKSAPKPGNPKTQALRTPKANPATSNQVRAIVNLAGKHGFEEPQAITSAGLFVGREIESLYHLTQAEASSVITAWNKGEIK